MSDEIITENAQSESTEARQSNITASDFVQRRLDALKLNEEQPQEVPQSEEAPVVSEEEPVAEESVSESTETEVIEEVSEDVLSKLDLENLSDAELQELSEKLGSRAVARYGELTAKRKAAEEQIKRLESELNKKNPLETQEVENNPYSDINTIEGLQEKATEINKVIEWAEDILFNSDEYGANDEVTQVEGKPLTKAEVRKSLLNARKSRDRFLPAQYQSLQKVEQSKVMKQEFSNQAVKELPWLSEGDSDTNKHYQAMVQDPRFLDLQKNVNPEMGAQLEYLIAHAANSIYGRKLVKDSPSSVKLTPPKTGITSASNAEKGVSKSSKHLQEMNKRFKQSGAKGDFISLRTLQLSQNR